MKHLTLLLIVLFAKSLYSQNKQGNTPGAEIFADTPYRIKKYDDNGNINGLPVVVFVHDGANTGGTYYIEAVDISIKNSTATSFPAPIKFNNYTDNQFNALFSNYSGYDAELQIQDFSGSGQEKSSNFTINFTADDYLWWFNECVEVNQEFWWFTFTIPGEKLAGLNNIIDIKVEIRLAGPDVNEVLYFRTFRYEDDYPKVQNWKRGDMHYHGMFTQNDSEVGFPLNATKLMAKYVGLDWITFTDHSCDFDNYGASISNNWNQLGTRIQNNNNVDNSLVLIRGLEMCLKNADGRLIHSLTYPNPETPYSMPFFGDGHGDLTPTNITVDAFSQALKAYDAFSYSAHPFAKGDQLAAIINGSVWNVGDAAFPQNGTITPENGEVICNNTSIASDVFSTDPTKIVKDNIIGGQVWNLPNALFADSDEEDPWNIQNYASHGFVELGGNDFDHYMTRYNQNLKVAEFIWKKGLQAKNANDNIQNWKYFLAAGSDAHGSYNYSTTDFFLDVNGQITDNAIGKLSTYAYCPNGMGNNGEEVLRALKNGNTVVSSGPIIVPEIFIMGENNPSVIPGTDIIISMDTVQNSIFKIKSATSDEYGIVYEKTIKLITQSNVYSLPLFPDTNEVSVNLHYILTQLFASEEIPLNEYFLLYTEIKTIKDYSYPALHRLSSETFECRSNPIWMKITPSQTTGLSYNNNYDKLNVYPNPASEVINVSIKNTLELDNLSFEIFNSQGISMLKEYVSKNNIISINISKLNSGIYFLHVASKDKSIIKSKFSICK